MRLAAGLFILLLAGCHGEPFQPRDHSTQRPFQAGPPHLLTANPGADIAPATLPDESGYLYSFDSWSEGGDACLGIFPVNRARVSRVFCPPADRGSSDRYLMAEVSPAGRAVFLLNRTLSGFSFPYYGAMMTAPLSDLRDTAELRPVPLVTPDGQLHRSVQKLGWYRGDTAAFLADLRVYLVAWQDPARTVTWLDLPPVMDFDGRASGFYLSLLGETEVFRLDFRTRSLVVHHDFGPAGSIGRFRVAGQRVIAATGTGLVLANTGTGEQIPISHSGLSIDALALAEGGNAILVQAPNPATGIADLWAVPLP